MLAATGILTFDYESDIEYKVVKVTNGISEEIVGREYHDDFEITFECKPSQQQTFYNDNLTWDEGEAPWSYTPIPWLGYDRKFTVTGGQTVQVTNAGTYKAQPVIILTGTGSSITIGGCTFKNLAGVVYIDCVDQVVYSQNGSVKTNRITDFSGDFSQLELQPGTTSFLIMGSFANLTIEFDYKNTYL
jgi:phage-related protein